MAATPARRTRHRFPHITRDTVLFVSGLGIILREAFLGSGRLERPYLLAAAMGMAGLPFVVRADEKRRGEMGTPDEELKPQ